MLKKEPSRLVQLICNAERSIEAVLAAYPDEYSQFGIGDDGEIIYLNFYPQ